MGLVVLASMELLVAGASRFTLSLSTEEIAELESRPVIMSLV